MPTKTRCPISQGRGLHATPGRAAKVDRIRIALACVLGLATVIESGFAAAFWPLF